MAEAGEARGDDPPGLPLARLSAYLGAAVPGLARGPLTAELIAGGRSNLTYLVTDGTERWVLRRPPLGHVLPTAHDMEREYRVLGALHPTAVPVPRPIHLAAGEAGIAAIGAPFYLMEYVAGTVLRTEEQLRSIVRPAVLVDRLMQTLADLHAVEPEAVGLGDLGRPEGYLERQLDRWLRQTSASKVRELPELERLAARLRTTLPRSQRTSLVHGDYRLDNVVVGANETIVAVLDWEMATRGDPLADLGNTLVWWDGMSGLDVPVTTLPSSVAGFPDGDALVASYAARTDLDLTNLDWYLGFAFFKVAAIFEGIHYRATQGLTVGDGFDRLGPLVPALLERGHTAVGRIRTFHRSLLTKENP